jgi:hypothetical protein
VRTTGSRVVFFFLPRENPPAISSIAKKSNSAEAHARLVDHVKADHERLRTSARTSRKSTPI